MLPRTLSSAVSRAAAPTVLATANGHADACGRFDDRAPRLDIRRRAAA